MQAQLTDFNLEQLVDRLDDVEGRRTPVGWTPDDAAERSSLERRIMELVSATDHEPDDGNRIPCTLAVKIRSKHDAVRGEVRDIRRGGIFIATAAPFGERTPVYVEVRGSGADEHGLRVRGDVGWVEDDGMGVTFAGHEGERHERRLRRFVLELLRHR